MNTFSSNFTELMTIMANPLSYIETKPTSSKTESFESTITEIVKKYNNQQFDQTHITPIIEILKKIIPSELKIDYTDLMDYFVVVQKFQSNPICSCYVRNHDKLEEYGDDVVVKSSELFLGFHCKTCGHFNSEHTVCKKYVHAEDYWCETCGLGKSEHSICMNYNNVDDDCNTCGFSWHEHQDKYDKMKIEDCGNFVPRLNCDSRCSNCIFNQTHHRYTKKFHLLNNDAKNNVGDLFFVLTADFLSMSEVERIEMYSQYYMITQMLTNHL